MSFDISEKKHGKTENNSGREQERMYLTRPPLYKHNLNAKVRTWYFLCKQDNFSCIKSVSIAGPPSLSYNSGIVRLKDKQYKVEESCDNY